MKYRVCWTRSGTQRWQGCIELAPEKRVIQFVHRFVDTRLYLGLSCTWVHVLLISNWCWYTHGTRCRLLSGALSSWSFLIVCIHTTGFRVRKYSLLSLELEDGSRIISIRGTYNIYSIYKIRWTSLDTQCGISGCPAREYIFESIIVHGSVFAGWVRRVKQCRISRQGPTAYDRV